MSGLRWLHVSNRPATFWVTALIVGAGLGVPQIGRAQVVSEALSVQYQAPEGCPSEVDYRRALTSRMRVQLPPLVHEAAREKSSVSVEIRSSTRGDYSGKLRVVLGGGGSVERSLSDAKCEVLVDALALLTSLELSAESSFEPQGAKGNPVVVAPSQPILSAESESKPAEPARKLTELSVAVVGGMVTAVAPNPLPTGGVAMTLGRLQGAQSIGLSMQYAQTSMLHFDGGDVRFRWAGLRIVGCPLGIRRRWLTVSACATTEVGVLRGEPKRTLKGTIRNGGWVAPGGGGLLTIHQDGFALELLSSAVFPLIRDEFYFAGADAAAPIEAVNRPPAIGLSVELRLGATF